MACESIVQFRNVFSLKQARCSRQPSVVFATQGNEIKNVLILSCPVFHHFVSATEGNEALKFLYKVAENLYWTLNRMDLR